MVRIHFSSCYFELTEFYISFSFIIFFLYIFASYSLVTWPFGHGSGMDHNVSYKKNKGLWGFIRLFTMFGILIKWREDIMGDILKSGK